MYPSTTISRVDRASPGASYRPYSSRPLWNSAVSGELRYFGSPCVDHPPTEADHAAAPSRIGKHEPVAEAVVVASAFLASRVDDQAGVRSGFALVSVAPKRLSIRSTLRRVSDGEWSSVAVKSALCGVIAGRASVAARSDCAKNSHLVISEYRSSGYWRGARRGSVTRHFEPARAASSSTASTKRAGRTPSGSRAPCRARRSRSSGRTAWRG